MAFSPDGALLATASNDDTARIWLAKRTGLRRKLEVAALEGHVGPVRAVAFSPDGILLATASDDGTARTWDAATGQHRATLTGHRGTVNAVVFSPDGTLLATASIDDTTRIWDVASSTHLATLIATRNGWAALLPDGRYKAYGDLGEHVWWAVKLCRFETGQLDPYVPGIRRVPDDVAVLPRKGARG